MHEIKQTEQKQHYLPPAAESARIMEAVKLGKYATTEHLSFCMGMAQEYECRPLESDEQNFYRFLCAIYNYGQVQGIRAERARGKQRQTTLFKPLTDKEMRELVACEGDNLDIQTTFDYFSDLVESNFDALKDCSMLDKMLWIVRDARLNGFYRALDFYNSAIKEALKA